VGSLEIRTFEFSLHISDLRNDFHITCISNGLQYFTIEFQYCVVYISNYSIVCLEMVSVLSIDRV